VKRTTAMKVCWDPNPTFTGVCLDKNCAKDCANTEGYTDGKCKGSPLRCFCSYPCSS